MRLFLYKNWLSLLSLLLSLLSILIMFAISGCTQPPVYTSDDPIMADNDRQDIAEPSYADPSLIWQYADRTVFTQAEQILNLDRGFGKLFGHPEQAWNINSFDEVPNSAWYNNRQSNQPMTDEQIRRGPCDTNGPDQSAGWTIIRAKVMGQTPGFWIEDGKGNRYILKFDPRGYPELATGAAAMASRYFYAMGYNVPEEYIVYWHPDNITIKEGLTYKAGGGVKRPFTQESLDGIIAKVHVMEDGRIRSLASFALPNVKGPFTFDSYRKDDPNDWCRHEHRRELRALYVFCSFINHWDIKDQNTLDIYADDSGNRYLKHYLIDFGTTFGSKGDGPQKPDGGYTNSFDLRDAIVSFFTLGLKKWQWEDASDIVYPTAGYFESEIFHPAKWDAVYPIPAFENMTNRDAYWAAKIVMSFSDDQLRSLLKAGQYSQPEVEDYLFEILKARRNKIGKHWFGKVNPLDNFSLSQSSNGMLIAFENLNVKYNLTGFNADHIPTLRYRHKIDISYNGRILIGQRIFSSDVIELSSDDLALFVEYFDEQNSEGKENPGKNLFKIQIRTEQAKKSWSKPVNLWLWFDAIEKTFRLVGIEHID